MTGSTSLGVVRLAVYLTWTALVVPIQWLVKALDLPLQYRIPLLYHRQCARIAGMALEVRGTISRDRPTLFISNHSSYLDITLLGALVPGSFVAKQEINGWPFFGMLARLQRSVFVDRRASQVLRDRSQIDGRLAKGDNLILFPEGTSSDGNRTLPFKSALFAVAEARPGGRPVTVQPVSITCTRLDGIPLGRGLRSIYAWYGDMDLVDHMWQMMKSGRLTIVVTFHPPVTFADFASRKALAEHCHRQVADGVASANAGRPAAAA